MAQSLVYAVDPAEPRAPSQEQWDRMTVAERAQVVEMLPAAVPLEVMAPEGDPHREAKTRALDALGGFFQRIGRKVYLSSELAVFYPGQPRFVPDVLAVLNVEPHPRMKWVAAAEGKGLDFVLEVHVSGSARKDHERNVERYAELGIAEYFLFDQGRLGLRGFRLPDASSKSYRAIVPQAGRFASRVLGLDLMIQEGRLRFFHGNAPLLEADELIGRLEGMVDELVVKKEEAERLIEEERQRADRAEQERDQERERAERAERELADLAAELERLRRERP